MGEKRKEQFLRKKAEKTRAGAGFCWNPALGGKTRIQELGDNTEDWGGGFRSKNWGRWPRK